MTEALDLHSQLFDMQGIIRLLLRMGIDLVFTCIVVLGVYARKHGKNEYLFTYVMFNIITFTLCFLLRQTPIELGFALGLFAVFGILRYRTEPIRIHELTYLFVVIGLGILNAVVNETVSLGEVLVVNGVIVASVSFLEFMPWFSGYSQMRVTYDDMDRIRSADTKALLDDLRERTGLDIQKVRVNDIDLLRETARVTVYYLQQ
ncbi:MAG: DUF4956 domain-containing protein [Myxococcota bacterium]